MGLNHIAPMMKDSLESALAKAIESVELVESGPGDSLNQAKNLRWLGLFGQEYLPLGLERWQDSQHRLLIAVPTRPAVLIRPDQCHCSY